MKKILLLLATVLTSVSAWAQQQTFSQTSDAPSGSQWAANTTWFIVSNGQGYLLSKDFADDSGNLKLTKNDSEPTDAILWCVSGNKTDGYKLYNKAAGPDKVLGITGEDASARATFVIDGTADYVTAFDFVQSTKTGNTYWCLKEKGTENNYWNNRSGYLAYWNDAGAQKADNGSAYLFEEVALSDIKEYSYQLTDNAGNSFEGRCLLIKENTKTAPQPTGVAGYSLTNKEWNGDSYTATINFPFPVSSSENVNKVMISSWSSETRKWYADGDKIKTVTNGNATRGNINEHMWAIYPQFADGKFTFKIKNYSKNTFIKHNGTTDDHTQNALSLVSLADGEESVFTWEANNRFLVVGTDQFLSTASSTEPNQYLGSHKNTGHNGSKLKIFTPYYLADLVLADECGTVYEMTGYRFADAQEEPTITGFVGGSFNDIQWKENKFTADIKFPFPVSSNEQLNATQIANFNATQKWNAVGSDVKVQQIGTPTSSEIATSLWGIYPIFENGAFTYKIKNVATQSWVTVNKTESSFDTQGTVTLTDEGTILELINWLGSPCFKLVGQTVYLTINGSSDSNVYLATWTGGNDGHGGNKLHFPKATYNVTVGSTGFATLYTPVAGTFAGNIKTYAIERVSNSSADLIEKTGIAANQGAIIEAAQGTYTFTAGEVSSDWSSNLLKGTSVNTYVEGDAYVLSNKNGIGLYKADLNKNAAGETGTTHFLNNAGKAYLPASAVTSNARFISFDFGTETAIESVESVENNAVVYDLAGRRVQGAQKGIFIVNGKKVIK